jgi:hypothetical protein
MLGVRIRRGLGCHSTADRGLVRGLSDDGIYSRSGGYSWELTLVELGELLIDANISIGNRFHVYD